MHLTVLCTEGMRRDLPIQVWVKAVLGAKTHGK